MSPRAFGHTGFTGTFLWIDPFSQSFVVFLSSRLHPDGKGDVTPLRRAIAAETHVLSRGAAFLATTAAATPFIGLFGTVWGIMNAFHDIYRMGNANLATVARPISEARSE